MKTIFTILGLLSFLFSIAQTTADFENSLPTLESFLNGSDGSGGFSEGNIFLPNSYDATFDAWSGWAISNTTDTVTGSFTNQYSSITGTGNDNSEGYAVTFVLGETLLNTTGAAQGGVVEGFYINNSTYAYRVMQDGNQFSKKFGGEDGTDPDFFYVTIKEHGNRNVVNDSITVFLADYRFDDPAEDYLLDTWTYVDLTRFENVDTLSFTMQSSDVGAFGINTPTYFCIDDFITTDRALTSTSDISENSLQLYPNPAVEKVFSAHYNSDYVLYNQSGQQAQAGKTTLEGWISVETLQSGLYYLKINGIDGKIYSGKVVKN